VADNSRPTIVIALALLLAVAGTLVFASRATRQARHFRTADEPIHGWMSIPFIAHTHHVPASVLFQAIGVEPRRPRDRRSVRRIARELNRPVPQLIAELQKAIDAARQPPGGPAR
jgi:hypothetical protein